MIAKSIVLYFFSFFAIAASKLTRENPEELWKPCKQKSPTDWSDTCGWGVDGCFWPDGKSESGFFILPLHFKYRLYKPFTISDTAQLGVKLTKGVKT